MKHRRKVVTTLGVLIPLLGWLVLFAILGQTPPAGADSDGYYCEGTNYLAVQFRSFNSPDLKASHLLRIASFGPDTPPHWSGQVEMTDFQPTWMRCDTEAILLAGWGDQTYVQYRVGAGADGQFEVLDRREDAKRPFGPPDAVLKNLGLWGKPGVYPLQSDDPDHTYAVLIRITERPGEGVLYRDHFSELVQLDPDGVQTASLVLFKGTSEEPIH